MFLRCLYTVVGMVIISDAVPSFAAINFDDAVRVLRNKFPPGRHSNQGPIAVYNRVEI